MNLYTAQQVMIGQTLAHYRIDSRIGEGGMGVVYRATDMHLDRPVAIKMLAADALPDEERKRRFVQEARAASALNHPNIITIHDIATANGVDYIVMEFVDGRTLGDLIGRQGLPLTETLDLAAQVAHALGRAHGSGIVHRDLKPANIMVSGEGRVKILDFGVAKLTETSYSDATRTLRQGSGTAVGLIVGTVAYMSPEQAEGKKVDTRSDIFSFGSVLYETLTGRRAFEGESSVSTLASILHHEPKPFSEVLPNAPRELERIVVNCLRKDPRRRFQNIEDVAILLDSLIEDLQSARLSGATPVPAMPTRRNRAGLLPAAALAAAVLGGALTWWVTLPATHGSSRGPVFTQVTFDSGLTTDPALSSDGKLVAYASDRAGASNLDIWVQQVAGGQPVQITHDAADDHDPAFSYDGSKIVFRSEREPAGVYQISTLGGEARLLAPGGRHPRFSPDGNWIAYSGAAELTPKVYILAAAGGGARELQTVGTPYAEYPLWSPDGKHLLFLGDAENSQHSPAGRLDWWVAPFQGGRAVATGAIESVQRHGLTWNVLSRPNVISGPRAWSGAGVLFSAALGSSMNLWRQPISPKDWQVKGTPHRLTAGSGRELQGSTAGDTVAFASIQDTVKLWSLPIDVSQGKVLGPPQRITQGAADDERPSISADGRKLAFLSNRSGNSDVWLLDMTSGKEKPVTATPGNESHPTLYRDGTKLCYGVSEGGKYVMYHVASADAKLGVPEKICDDCGPPMDWSSDGRKVLYWRPGPVRWFTIDVNTREIAEVVPRIDNDIHNVRYSPDGGWVSFDVPAEHAVFVAALKGGVAVSRYEWTRVSEGVHPWWSPDGKLLYFLSARDGFQCLWAQPLTVDTRRPAGPIFTAQHFHGARRTPNAAALGWGLASDMFVLPIREITGNLWLAKLD